MSSMRTGADYRESLRDGRRVCVLGEGLVEDVTTHPATRAMVEEYVAWYDRHFDPAWQDTLLTPPRQDGKRSPVGYLVPRSADDLARMGRCFSATTFLSAGNITHTPAYGHLIALGVLHAVNLRNASPEQVANAEAYRARDRAHRPLPDLRRRRRDRSAIACAKIPPSGRRSGSSRQTDAGLVIRGKIGMHTSPAFAEDVYIGAHNGVDCRRPSRDLRRRRQRARRHRGLPQARRRAMPTLLRAAQHAASTSSTARCGSTTC